MNTGCRDTPAAAERRGRVQRLLEERWSPKKFAAKDVDDATLGSLFAAARLAPSWFNDQPWGFVVADRRDPEHFARMLGLLTERNRAWAAQAPLLVLALATTESARGASASLYGPYDLGHAVGNLTVQAVACGLQVHQMGGFDHEAARSALKIPPDRQPVALLAIGYPAEEQPARNRRPITSIVFEGVWGNAARFLHRNQQTSSQS